MKYHLIYREEVFKEIDDAYSNYEHKQKGLGDRLLEAVQKAENSIKLNPLGYQIKYDVYRTKMTKPFPFILVYEVIKKEIIVYQFFCSLDNPEKRFKK